MRLQNRGLILLTFNSKICTGDSRSIDNSYDTNLPIVRLEFTCFRISSLRVEAAVARIPE